MSKLPCFRGRGLGAFHVVIFAVNKRPDFIDLYALGFQIAKCLVLIGGDGVADSDEYSAHL